VNRRFELETQMKRTLTLATLMTLGAAAWLPLPSMAQTGINLVISSAPPAPRFESVPAPRRGYVWAPGYWNWDGYRHAWTSGHWEAVRNGYQYHSTEWVRDDRGYRLHHGGWQPVARAGYDEIRVAPPAPRYERVPHARHGYVWEPGRWEWRRNRHEWIAGTWLADRPGYVYSQASWIERDGRWYMEPSRWAARGRDRDHDGIADRHDRDRDNDGIPNRRDADRDGDGVRNDRDHRPDDRRRN
jgi:hypothetical protein